MASTKPQDYNAVLMDPGLASAVQRSFLSLGQFTANTTVTPAPRFIADRKLVIREIWIAASAVPADPDGTMLLNAIVKDKSEAADDTIVSNEDLEALITVANEGFKATLAAETAENQNTMEAGDVLRFTLVNDSAGIGTNADISVVVVWQPLAVLES